MVWARLVLHPLSGIGQDGLEQPFVIIGQGIGFLGVLTLRERGIRIQIGPHISPAALYQVVGHSPSMGFVLAAGQVLGQVYKLGPEQLQQRAESALIAAVRCGRDQDQMPFLIPGEFLEQLMPEMAATALVG